MTRTICGFSAGWLTSRRFEKLPANWKEKINSISIDIAKSVEGDIRIKLPRLGKLKIRDFGSSRNVFIDPRLVDNAEIINNPAFHHTSVLNLRNFRTLWQISANKKADDLNNCIEEKKKLDKMQNELAAEKIALASGLNPSRLTNIPELSRKSIAEPISGHDANTEKHIYTKESLAELSILQQYLSSGQKQIKLRNGQTIRLETIVFKRKNESIYSGLKNSNSSLFNTIKKDLQIITGIATELNKDIAVEQYLKNANMLFVARDKSNKIIGYVIAQTIKPYGIPTLFIWGNHELPHYQGLGLGTALNFEAIKTGKKLLGLQPWSPLYGAYRTWNPAAYKITFRADLKVFPEPNQDGTGIKREAHPTEIAALTYIAQNLLNNQMNANTAVLTNSIDPPKKINWVNIPKIDIFFKTFVDIFCGNSLLVKFTLPRFIEILHPLREYWIRFGLLFKLFVRNIPLINKLVKIKKSAVDWNNYFKAYDVLSNFHPYKELMNKLSTIIGEISTLSALKILDVGSGTGNVTLELKKKFASHPAVSIYSLDNSEEANRIHTEKNAEANIISFNLDQKEAILPFSDNSLNIITSNHVLNYLKNKDAHLGELFRIIKPGGILVISVLKKGFKPLAVLKSHLLKEFRQHRKESGFFRSLRHVFYDFIKINPELRIVGEANKIILDGAKKGTYTLFSKNEIIELLEKAGFQVLICESGYADQNFTIKAIKPLK